MTLSVKTLRSAHITGMVVAVGRRAAGVVRCRHAASVDGSEEGLKLLRR